MIGRLVMSFQLIGDIVHTADAGHRVDQAVRLMFENRTRDGGNAIGDRYSYRVRMRYHAAKPGPHTTLEDPVVDGGSTMHRLSHRCGGTRRPMPRVTFDLAGVASGDVRRVNGGVPNLPAAARPPARIKEERGGCAEARAEQ
jgi:hypothetical protein